MPAALDVSMDIEEDWMKQTAQMHETSKKKEEITNIIVGGQDTKDNVGRTRKDNVFGQTTNRRDNV
jgi:hypothetical protein